ncbi:MAG: putative glycoside hydrolase, partial [Candidatus Riflemargulisbacteria bacterium]
QWVDLFSQDALNYYKKLVELAIAAGADDIQLDYIRFPSDGDVSNIIAKHNKLKQKRYKAVDNYLKEIVKITDKKNISFSADIFGIVLWDNPQTNSIIGQYTLTFMRYADVICPMLYPSHFNPGFDGIAKPGENPYLFMDKGCKKFTNSNTKDQYYVKVVPWIQAFNYMSPNFNEKYIQDQIRACLDNKMDGIFAWNAGNDYTVFFNSLKSGILE